MGIVAVVALLRSFNDHKILGTVSFVLTDCVFYLLFCSYNRGHFEISTYCHIVIIISYS